MKIYVVIGTTGEYSDRTEWLVKAFESENSAKKMVIEFSEKAREIWDMKEKDYKTDEFELGKVFDPDFRMDNLTGTSYFLCEVELIRDKK
jgi:hypothetical protein